MSWTLFDYRSVTEMIEVIESQSQAYYLLKQKQIYWMVKEQSSLGMISRYPLNYDVHAHIISVK